MGVSGGIQLAEGPTAIGVEPRLPLKRGEFYRCCSAATLLPWQGGVFVSERGRLALVSHDLTRRIWERESKRWISELLFDGNLLVGPSDGPMLWIDPRSGALIREIAAPEGLLLGWTKRTVLLQTVSKAKGSVGPVAAIDRENGALLWTWEGTSRRATPIGERYLLAEPSGHAVSCRDALDGKVLWTTQPVEYRPDWRGVRGISNAFPSVVHVNGRVVIVTRDGQVSVLSPSTGGILKRRKVVQFSEAHLVTQRAVFFFDGETLVEVELARLDEVGRVNLSHVLRPLYGSRSPSVCGFLVTRDSVLWTTRQGSLMAASRRRSARSQQQVYSEDCQGLFVVGEAPLAWADFVYVRDSGGGTRGDHLGVHCFRGQPAGLRRS